MTHAPVIEATNLRARVATLAADIKLSHTIFALPFALLATILAAGTWPHAGQIALVLLCMVTARTVAMSANRLIDARLDAANPRTRARAVPSGRLPAGFVQTAIVTCAALFIATTSLFWVFYDNPLPVILSVPVLAFISAYPFLKRFTQLCHYYLGAALGLAPICAWIAINPTFDWTPILLSGSVLCWTAGFDIIYACQDYRSDLETGTFSIPAKLGISGALWIARFTHVVSLTLLILLGLHNPFLHTLYWIGVAIVTVLLIVEHSIVKPTDLSKVNVAFFTINGVISVILGTLGIVDVLL
jgi:4-hydroxybenzoate polyprenyltransferase